MGKWNIFKREESKNTEKKEIRYILSIDGGGMRGVVPSYVLSKINQKVKEYSDRPLYSYFDLIVGTSTGALLALGLTSPKKDALFKVEDGPDYPIYEKRSYKKFFKTYSEDVLLGYARKSADPNALVQLYLENGCKIFNQPSHIKKLLGNVFSNKYDAQSLEHFLDEVYGDTALSDVLAPTLVTAFNPLTSKPYAFKSWDSHGFLLKEAARASAAAPTYFAPITLVDRENNETITLVDGGLAVNNPILYAYSHARELYPNADEFRVISLSTCALSASFDPTSTSGGLTTWVSSLWKSYASGTMGLADEVARNIKDMRYLRIWGDVVEKKFSLDDYSDEAMNTLLNAAEKIYKEKEIEISSFIEDMVNGANSDSINLKAKEEELLLTES